MARRDGTLAVRLFFVLPSPVWSVASLGISSATFYKWRAKYGGMNACVERFNRTVRYEWLADHAAGERAIGEENPAGFG